MEDLRISVRMRYFPMENKGLRYNGSVRRRLQLVRLHRQRQRLLLRFQFRRCFANYMLAEKVLYEQTCMQRQPRQLDVHLQVIFRTVIPCQLRLVSTVVQIILPMFFRLHLLIPIIRHLQPEVFYQSICQR